MEPHHLYLNGDTAAGQSVILRYALHNGLPERKPDLVITGFAYLAGVSRDGTLYAGAGHRTIYAFRFGAKKPDRRFRIPLPGGCSGLDFLTATTVDPRGDFWVTTEPFSQPAFARDLPLDAIPCQAALAFGPRARGNPAPIQVFSIAGQAEMVIDSKSELFVDATGNHTQTVYKYVDILTNPTLAEIYQGRSFDIYGAYLATDDSDDLYVDTDLPDGNSGVAVWAPGAKPAGPPTWVIKMTGKNETFGLAVGPRYLYTANPISDSIDVYLARQGGVQKPLASVPIPLPLPLQLLAGP